MASPKVKGQNQMTDTAPASANGLVEIDFGKATKHTLTLNLPEQLRDVIRAEATKRDTHQNFVAREILASFYGMKILDTPKAAKVESLPGLTKEQRNEVRKREASAKRERAASITDAILKGTLPLDVLEKYGLSHLVPKSAATIAAEVLAETGVPTVAVAATESVAA